MDAEIVSGAVDDAFDVCDVVGPSQGESVIVILSNRIFVSLILTSRLALM